MSAQKIAIAIVVVAIIAAGAAYYSGEFDEEAPAPAIRTTQFAPRMSPAAALEIAEHRHEPVAILWPPKATPNGSTKTDALAALGAHPRL
jgi:hypothetical protein